MNDQVIETYDRSPNSILDSIKRVLGGAVGAKCRDLGYKSLVFYCKDYDEAKPYLKILSYSGLKVYWIRKLPTNNVKENLP